MNFAGPTYSGGTFLATSFTLMKGGKFISMAHSEIELGHSENASNINHAAVPCDIEMESNSNHCEMNVSFLEK